MGVFDFLTKKQTLHTDAFVGSMDTNAKRGALLLLNAVIEIKDIIDENNKHNDKQATSFEALLLASSLMFSMAHDSKNEAINEVQDSFGEILIAYIQDHYQALFRSRIRPEFINERLAFYSNEINNSEHLPSKAATALYSKPLSTAISTESNDLTLILMLKAQIVSIYKNMLPVIMKIVRTYY